MRTLVGDTEQELSGSVFILKGNTESLVICHSVIQDQGTG